jgi:hypothetical protein
VRTENRAFDQALAKGTSVVEIKCHEKKKPLALVRSLHLKSEILLSRSK